MKSLQDKYTLIKEGKGNKELFIKEARTLFPNVVTGALTFDQAIHNLTERGIISENITGVLVSRKGEPNWFQIFNENTEAIKATLKDTDKSIKEKEVAGYDYEDKKNNNNISTAEILKGYYVEMKDPKNAEKTEEELKKIVFKNLEKDPMHYIKDGAFGIKGIGYTEDAPGLGATKEITGKYKSSGMEPVKLNENKHHDLNEGFGDSLKDAMKRAYEGSLEGYVQHVEDNGDGTFSVSDWYDGDKTVVSYEDGRKFNDRTRDFQSDYMERRNEYTEALTEAKKRAIEKHLKEIEKLGEVAAYEYKANKIQEKIEELKNKITMTESDDVKEMVDKNAIKEIKKDIALLEKRKKMYEAKKAQAAKRVSGDAVRPKAAGGEEIIDEAKEKKPVWQEAMKSVLKKKGY